MIKHSIKFELFRGERSECLPIRVRVTYGRKRVDFRLGYSVEPGRWNAAEGRVTSGKNRNGQSAAEINRAILVFSDAVENVFVRFDHMEKRAPSPAELREAITEVTRKSTQGGGQDEKSFFAVFDEFTRVMGEQNEWEHPTYVKFGSLKNHLEKFDSRLNFTSLTEEKLQEYKAYLHDRADLRNTTIQKNLSFLRWFLRWAHAKGYYTGTLHESFHPRMKGIDGNNKEVVHLTWEELMHLLTFEFTRNKNALSDTRDVFCFCCFTGLRHSDVISCFQSQKYKL